MPALCLGIDRQLTMPTHRPLIAICDPILAADRSALDVARHCVSLRALGRAIIYAADLADFRFITVLSGLEDASGAQMAIACSDLAAELQLPHVLLSSPQRGKPPAVNVALNQAWPTARS